MKNFIVVDDFLKDPDLVREKALRCRFQRGSPEVPGFHTTNSIEIPGMVSRLRELLPGDVPYINKKGRFQYFTRHRKNYIHADPHLRWIALLTLCHPGQDESPGTTFYTHRPTGLNRIPIDSGEWRLRHLTGDGKMDARVEAANRDRFRYHLWKPSLSIPKKYNRLLLFRPHYFHMGVGQEGTHLQNGILTFILGMPVMKDDVRS